MPFMLLIAAAARRRGASFRFDAPEVTIGRAAENDLVLHDPHASRRHARIRAHGDGYALLDDGSSNGTQVNARLASGATRLRDGDRIQLGSTVLEFAVARETLALVHARRVFAAAAAAVGRWSWRVRAAVAVAASLTVAVSVLAARTAMRGRAASAPAPTPPSATDPRGTDDAAPEMPGTAEMFPDAVGQSHAARDAFERGRRKLDERRIAPRNLYDAWRGFTAAADALERAEAGRIPPGTSPATHLARLIRWTERELENQCKRLLFAAARSERYGRDAQVQAAYREVLLHFPGDDPTGCRKKAQEALASIETPVPGGGVFGYPEER